MIRRFSMMMALLVACAGFGQSMAADESDMNARLQQLEQELQELRNEGIGGEAELKNEASNRYDGKFSSKLRRDNMSFEFNLENLIQARFQMDDVNDSASSYVKEEDSAGFRLARVYTRLHGHVYNPAFTYMLEGSWNNDTIDGMLKRAVFGYTPSDSYGFYIGRDKLPFNMQESANADALQFMERSAANEAFNLDYGHGGWISGAPSLGETGMMLRYSLGIFNGQYNNLRQTDTAATPNNEDFAWTYLGRVEFLPMGGDGSITESESDLRSDEDKGKFLAMIGLGANYARDRGTGLDRNTPRTIGTTGIASPFEADILNAAIDARIHIQGASLNAGVFGRFVRFDDASDETAAHPGHLEDFGWYFQAGYNINMSAGQLEVMARISQVDYDEFSDGVTAGTTGRDAMGNDVTEFTLGTNFRVYGDDLRFSAEGTYRTEEEAANFNDIPSFTLRLGVQIRF